MFVSYCLSHSGIYIKFSFSVFFFFFLNEYVSLTTQQKVSYLKNGYERMSSSIPCVLDPGFMPPGWDLKSKSMTLLQSKL